MLTVKISILLVSLLVWIGLIVILRRWAKSQQRLAYGPPRCWRCLYEIDPAVGAERCPKCGADLRVAQSEMTRYKRLRAARWRWMLASVPVYLLAIVWVGVLQTAIKPSGMVNDSLRDAAKALTVVGGFVVIFLSGELAGLSSLPKIKEPRDNR